MAQAFKKPKNKKHTFIIVTSIVIALGILAFVLAYGISKGWMEVAMWFGSKWAVLLYIFGGFYIILVAYILIYEKIKKMY